MHPTPRHPHQRLHRSLFTILVSIAALLMGWQSAMADGSSVSGSDSATIATLSTAATPDADASLIEQLPGDEDAAIAVGVTAVTVMGLAGLAMLDRKPDVADHES